MSRHAGMNRLNRKVTSNRISRPWRTPNCIKRYDSCLLFYTAECPKSRINARFRAFFVQRTLRGGRRVISKNIVFEPIPDEPKAAEKAAFLSFGMVVCDEICQEKWKTKDFA